MSDKKLYKLDDHILFRKCDLYDGCDTQHGDCTNFKVKQVHCQDNYFCNQEGFHFHCARHPEIEYDNSEDGTELVCPKCGTPVYIGNRHELISRCLKALNRDIFKDATLIRLDDWYIPELKEKRSPSPNYRLTVYIKTDKDEDTIVVLYVSYVGSGNKVQYFIKPEKGQLTSDHKDMDPSKIISKIEVTLKDRKLSQEYDSE